MKWVSFFIHDEKGRLRPARSGRSGTLVSRAEAEDLVMRACFDAVVVPSTTLVDDLRVKKDCRGLMLRLRFVPCVEGTSVVAISGAVQV